MMEFIRSNKTEEEHDEDDNNLLEENIKLMFEQLLGFFMNYVDDEVELMFFFKSCFMNFDLSIKDLRKLFYGLGKVYADE